MSKRRGDDCLEEPKAVKRARKEEEDEEDDASPPTEAATEHHDGDVLERLYPSVQITRLFEPTEIRQRNIALARVPVRCAATCEFTRGEVDRIKYDTLQTARFEDFMEVPGFEDLVDERGLSYVTESFSQTLFKHIKAAAFLPEVGSAVIERENPCLVKALRSGNVAKAKCSLMLCPLLVLQLLSRLPQWPVLFERYFAEQFQALFAHKHLPLPLLKSYALEEERARQRIVAAEQTLTACYDEAHALLEHRVPVFACSRNSDRSTSWCYAFIVAIRPHRSDGILVASHYCQTLTYFLNEHGAWICPIISAQHWDKNKLVIPFAARAVVALRQVLDDFHMASGSGWSMLVFAYLDDDDVELDWTETADEGGDDDGEDERHSSDDEGEAAAIGPESTAAEVYYGTCRIGPL
jgi:hypothetical protein